MDFNVTLVGFSEARKLLSDHEKLYLRHWRAGMADLRQKAGGAAKQGAPFRTGQLRSMINTGMARGAFPRWIAVRNRAVKKSRAYKRGYPYPRLLAYSPKHGHRDWLKNAIKPVWGSVDGLLERIGSKIQATWSKS